MSNPLVDGCALGLGEKAERVGKTEVGDFEVVCFGVFGARREHVLQVAKRN
jgi:hypothetical protein